MEFNGSTQRLEKITVLVKFYQFASYQFNPTIYQLETDYQKKTESNFNRDTVCKQLNQEPTSIQEYKQHTVL